MAFAFIILSIFVGYGLVAIPTFLWRKSSFENELNDSLVILVDYEEKLTNYEQEVRDICAAGLQARIAGGLSNYEEIKERRD